MSENQRNFWIVVTMVALGLASLQWITTWEHNREKAESSCRMSCSATTFQTAPRITTPHGVDQAPKALNMYEVKRRVLRSYSCGQRRHGVEGEVLARVWVDQDGNYIKHRVLNQSNSDMGYRVSRQLSHLRFQPARHHGRREAAAVDILITFPY